MESVRQSKVAKLLQKELAEIFRANAKTMFNDAFVTVTVVRISSDLSSAKIYISIMASKDVNATYNMINDQKQHIRKILGNLIGKQVRVVPEISFFIDDSYDYLLRMAIYSLTKEMFDKLKQDFIEKKVEIKAMEETDPKDMYLLDLTELKKKFK
jgi:ribosome-binding factor A